MLAVKESIFLKAKPVFDHPVLQRRAPGGWGCWTVSPCVIGFVLAAIPVSAITRELALFRAFIIEL